MDAGDGVAQVATCHRAVAWCDEVHGHCQGHCADLRAGSRDAFSYLARGCLAVTGVCWLLVACSSDPGRGARSPRGGSMLEAIDLAQARTKRTHPAPREEPAKSASELAGGQPRLQRTRLTPPVSGVWTVSQGYQGADTHVGRAAYALDLVKLGPDFQAYRKRGARLKDWYSFGAPAYAVADGVVVTVVDRHPDDPVLAKSRGEANRVIIQHASDEFSEFVHLQRGSARVKVGDRVRRGEVIARCGNSGAQTPHLHWAFLSAITPIRTRPAKMAGYDVRDMDRWRPTEGIPKRGEVLRSCTAACQPACLPSC